MCRVVFLGLMDIIKLPSRRAYTPTKSPFSFLNKTASVCATHASVASSSPDSTGDLPLVPLEQPTYRPTPVIRRAPDKRARDVGLGRH